MVKAMLSKILEGLQGTVEKKLERMSNLIYEYGVERFGARDPRKNKTTTSPKSRRQREIECLVKERRDLRKQRRKGSIEEREGINLLQTDLKMPGKTTEGRKPQNSMPEEGAGKNIILQGSIQICERAVHKGEEWSTPSVKEGTWRSFENNIHREPETWTEGHTSWHATHSSTRTPV